MSEPLQPERNTTTMKKSIFGEEDTFTRDITPPVGGVSDFGVDAASLGFCKRAQMQLSARKYRVLIITHV